MILVFSQQPFYYLVFFQQYYFIILPMASFYICRNQKTPSLPPTQESSDLDVGAACKILRKAALKLSEIPAKLQLSKVVRFLQNMHNEVQNKPHHNTHQSKDTRTKNQLEMQVTFKNVEDLTSKPPHEMLKSSTKSLMSVSHDENAEQEVSIYKKLTNSEVQNQNTGRFQQSNKENYSSLLMDNFKWREVVTKNVLEECEGNRKTRSKEGSYRDQPTGDREKTKVFQDLMQENSTLKKYILNIYQFFQTKKLIQLPKILPLQLRNLETISKQLFSGFERREVEREFQRKKLMQIKSEYLQTLKNISIDLRVESIAKVNENNTMHDPLSSKVEQMQKQISKISDKLKQKEEENNKYEMMLFIKEEEISSLRVLNSNLENRVNKLAKTHERTRSKSVMRVVEHVEQHINATVS